MKIKKVFTYTWVPAIFFVLSLANCVPDPVPSLILTLQQKIQGKTYVLGSVTRGGTDVTSDFTGFKIAFGTDGDSYTIVSPSVPCLSGDRDINIGENTITTTGTGTVSPFCGSSTASSVMASDDGSTLSLTFVLNLPSIVITPTGRTSGLAEYRFSLVKQ